MSLNVERLDDVYLHMRQTLRKAILRIVQNDAEADELTQEAYLRARRALQDTVPDNLEAFLWRTARNLALDHLRRRKVRSIFEKHDATETDIAEIPDVGPDLEEQAIQRERLRLFTQALEALPRRVRQVWHLGRIEGLSYPEIARLLGVSPNTVFNDMKHAMGVMLDLKTRMDRS
ncbi:sigma-70 family RNA polymerase sigma factor [Agrobacterium tumefaciens]|uniref:RNA polymerase sigma factor n=1 Tax=Agrobacterium tumefaciens TaxID=358 RepID=UPI00287D7E02|nr:sigma-70 family RNA polymerase sigma factor [Agrobacterium tumefaciens]MDS7593951.1 sigma-70 family RNA polymerase sigma factor [Agrobacterium tumefaciens]